jgi:hypothetical protein
MSNFSQSIAMPNKITASEFETLFLHKYRHIPEVLAYFKNS